jgi:protein SCO1/2
VYPAPQPLNTFSLVDHQNRPYGLGRLKGGWTFLFFGYTHCPDVCPATLSQMTQLSRVLNKKMTDSPQPKFLFVSVDPGRDTVGVLKGYINYFDQQFIAATGTKQNIEAFEHQLGVNHHLGEKNPAGDYSVAHSAGIFLIDPHAQVVAKFTPPLSVKEVSLQYRDLVAYFRSKSANG